jgi:hypothetical protein
MQLLVKYCEIPFGKMHSKNPEIISLAERIGRTPSAVAMKMVNFASLDPTVNAKGMGNVSKLDRMMWEKFLSNIDKFLLEESDENDGFGENYQDIYLVDTDFSSEDIQALLKVRVGQGRFRKIVLASYEGRCAISNLSESRLLIASHIAPWAVVKERRLDPRNGICLNALWDKAFDKGLVGLSDNLELLYSDRVERSTREKLESMGGRFRPPTKFGPDARLLAAHRERFGIAG